MECNSFFGSWIGRITRIAAPLVLALLWCTGNAFAQTEPPFGCTVIANPLTLPPAGGRVDLGVTCSGGATPTGYQWYRGTSQDFTLGSTSATATDTLTAAQGPSVQYVVGIDSSAGRTVVLSPIVTFQTIPSPPLSNCSVIARPSSLSSLGGRVDLSVTCGTGTATQVTQWQRTSSTSATPITISGTGLNNSDTLPANQTSSAIIYVYSAEVRDQSNNQALALSSGVIVPAQSSAPPTTLTCSTDASPRELASAGGPVTLTATCSGTGQLASAGTWTRQLQPSGSSTNLSGATLIPPNQSTVKDTLPANTSTSAVTYKYTFVGSYTSGGQTVSTLPVDVLVVVAPAAGTLTCTSDSSPAQLTAAGGQLNLTATCSGTGQLASAGTWTRQVLPNGTPTSLSGATLIPPNQSAIKDTVAPNTSTAAVTYKYTFVGSYTSGGQTVNTAAADVLVVVGPGTQDATPAATPTVTIQQQVAVDTPRVQIANVQTRLDQLRLQNNPAVAQGLRLSYDGKPLPWQLLAQAVTPTKTDATAAPADTFERNGIFVQGDIEVGHQNSTGGTSSGFDLRSKGLTIGADHRFEGNSILGAALGLLRADTTVRNDGGTQDAKGYSFSLYGSYNFSQSGYVSLIGNIGRNDYDGNRNVLSPNGTILGTASSSTSGTQYGIALSAGYDFYRENLSIGPYGRVQYVHAKINPFTETGVPAEQALSVGEQTTNATFLTIGGQANWAIPMTWGILQPNARLEWQYQAAGDGTVAYTLFSNQSTAGGQPLTLAGQDKSYGVGSVGVQLILPYSIQAYFNFESPFGKSNYTGQRYTLGVRVGF